MSDRPDTSSNPEALKAEAILFLLTSAKDDAEYEQARKLARQIADLPAEQVLQILGQYQGQPKRFAREGDFLQAVRQL